MTDHTIHWDDRDRLHYLIDDSARVSAAAWVGFPGEWRHHPTRYPARIMAGAVISEGARVQAGCERETIVGPGAFIMAGAHIGHDARIGAGADICPNAVICGGATIGESVKVYSAAVVSPGVTVGDSAIIAANSTVTRDVPPNEVWGGSPAKYIRDRDPF